MLRCACNSQSNLFVFSGSCSGLATFCLYGYLMQIILLFDIETKNYYLLFDIETKNKEMIRISTLIALGLVVGHLSVLCRGKLEARSESALVDIDPDVSEHLDDNTQDQEDVPASPGERVNDPYWRYRFRYRKYRRKCSKRYRYGRRCKPTRKPYPSHKPHPTSKPFSHTPSCDSSRPPSNPEWNNDWRGRMFFQCPAGKIRRHFFKP